MANKEYMGLFTDNHYSTQPKGTYSFALNATNSIYEGFEGFISNENSNEAVEALPDDYVPIGHVYVTNDRLVIISVKTDNSRTEIGFLDKAFNYTTMVNTANLNMRIDKQADITFRTRKGNKVHIYWVDALNNARQCNLGNLDYYYTAAYTAYLAGGGNPATYVPDKYDAIQFELIKSYRDIPKFSNIEVLDYGHIESGSYNMSIRLVGADFDNTEWITTSNTVNIYVDSTTSQFKDIEGSRDVQNESQFFEKANKAIKVTFTDLDTSFAYYQVAVIKSTDGTGKPNQVLVSELIDINQDFYIYSGQDEQMSEESLVNIKLDKMIIKAPESIEQLENRLILANGKDTIYNWCEYQTYASKIKTDVAYKEVILNSVNDVANPKNPTATFVYRGYMPGEVYSMGIVYLMEDYSLSPVFHIPGVPATAAASDMLFYQGTGKYNNIHSCNGVNDYWGNDYNGDPLLGEFVRQHRFPFRTDVNKPLFTNTNQTVNVTKYLISITISLLPPAVFPANTSIIINYNLSGLGLQSVLLPVTAADMGVPIVVYDDVYEPILMPGSPDYIEVDAASDILQYQTPIITPSTFTIVLGTPTAYASTETVADAVTSDIFGFEFSNIDKPPGVIGFHIVRAEKGDEDKLIVDNGIMGATTTANNYVAFGKFYPDIFSTTNAVNPVVNTIQNLINNVGTYTQSQTNDIDSAYIYSPEHQYFNKRQQFQQVKLEGEYIWGRAYYPFAHPNVPGNGVTPKYGSDLNGIKGQLFLDSVQAGTLTDTSASAVKFNVQCGYKIETFNFNIDNGNTIDTEDVLYIDAADSVTKGDKIYFNASNDNKMGIVRFGDASGEAIILEQPAVYDTDPIYENRIPKCFKLKYVALVDDKDNCYGNFITRNFYKEQNNPTMFGLATTINGHKVFNGDATIGASHLVNSHFWSQIVGNGLGSGTYQIIAGIFSIIGGVLVTVATDSATLGALLVGYGVSSITSGIKISKLQAMMDTHYAAGLKKALTDVLTSCLFPNTTPNNQTIWQWYSEQCKNIWIESCVNIPLRSGLGFSYSDFLNSPDENFIAIANIGTYNTYLTYLTEKLTVFDTQTGQGRLYKGYAGAEFYDMNLDYLRFNKEKLFYHLPIEYDCCSNERDSFTNRVWYSEQSFQEELKDNYRQFLPNNYRDIESEYGIIKDLFKKNNQLYIHTSEGLWELPKNIQEKVTNEFIQYIGTGEFFSIPPRLISDSQIGNMGSSDKWATIKTPYGILFVSEIEGKVYLFEDGIKPISDLGMRNYFENNLKSFFGNQFFELTGEEFPNKNNPANNNGVGYISAYDSRFERFLITKKDYLLLPEKEQYLEIVDETPISYSGAGNPPFLPNIMFSLEDNKFYIYVVTDTFNWDATVTPLSFTNKEYFQDKSFTISFSPIDKTWISWHSYLPTYYMFTPNNLFSFESNEDFNIYKHNKKGDYLTFYGQDCKHYFEFVSPMKPLETNISEYVKYKSTATKYESNGEDKREDRDTTFKGVVIYNDEQCTGDNLLVIKNKADVDYYVNQVVNSIGNIIVSKNESYWSFNDFRDYRNDYSDSIFDSSWTAIQSQYFIDKIVKASGINLSKNWWELQQFRSNFVVIRLMFEGNNDVQLTTQYIADSKKTSIR